MERIDKNGAGRTELLWAERSLTEGGGPCYNNSNFIL